MRAVRDESARLLAGLMVMMLWSYAAQAAAESGRSSSVPTTISVPAQQLLQSALSAPKRVVQLPGPEDLDAWRKLRAAQEAASEAAVLKAIASNEVDVTAATLGGVSVLDIRPKRLKESPDVLVFLHGGAYTMNSARSGLPHAAPLARISGLRVVSIDYATAPFASWQKMQQQVVDVMQALLREGHSMKNIAVVGASAGGGLAVAAVLNLRDRGIGMPCAVVLWSPWVDLSEEGDTMQTLRDSDPFLDYGEILRPSAMAYAGGLDLKDPRISPIYADFSKGFAPTLIQEGTRTIFLSSSARLFRSLDDAGQDVVFDLYEGMVHVFQKFPLPESEAAIEKSAAFIKARQSGSSPLHRPY